MQRTLVGLLVLVTLGVLFVSFATEAQQPTQVPRIGFLLIGPTPERERNVDLEAFQEGLRTLGYVEGQNLRLEYRSVEGQYERLPALAAELVRLKVDVLLVATTPAVLAAKQATSTIPIVMVGIHDPVGSGLVASLARPGGNITGLSILSPELVEKQLGFLKYLLPTVSRVAILWNPARRWVSKCTSWRRAVPTCLTAPSRR